MIKFFANSLAYMSLNKFISDLFSTILTIFHILFFVVIAEISATKTRDWVRMFIPDVFLQSNSREGLIILLIVVYVLTMGTICTLLVIKQYLKEIRDNLIQLNNTTIFK
jgi:hypothetical protein